MSKSDEYDSQKNALIEYSLLELAGAKRNVIVDKEEF